jgi:hypothetical protein
MQKGATQVYKKYTQKKNIYIYITKKKKIKKIIKNRNMKTILLKKRNYMLPSSGKGFWKKGL